MTSYQVRAHPLGDSAVTISFGTERTAELLEGIHAAARSLEAARIPHVEDVVPAYLAVTVFYDALHTTYAEMAEKLVEACEQPARSAGALTRQRHHLIPVRYDGMDLESIAAATGLSTSEVVARHAVRTYTVDLIGFVPGFAYMSELDPSLQIPRRPEPRSRVPAGSVAIAAALTGVYPLDTPGGWHIIGHTDTRMFDPTREPPALLQAGDTVRFERVKE
ncbi:MAG TPA: 5-oxoprolinase subunit PxpB [Gemmatimonadaceae bacterium]|nr:5-oxoprolinase subunit PxpB [Gemmatimonadaceae bacterium]